MSGWHEGSGRKPPILTTLADVDAWLEMLATRPGIPAAREALGVLRSSRQLGTLLAQQRAPVYLEQQDAELWLRFRAGDQEEGILVNALPRLAQQPDRGSLMRRALELMASWAKPGR